MKRMRYLALLVLAVAAQAAMAADDSVTYSFAPENPIAGTMLHFRIDVVGCSEAQIESLVHAEQHRIEVRVHAPDFCDPDVPGATETPRFHAIGVLPPGLYTASIYSCGGPVPPPLPPCQMIREQQIVVRSSSPATVPADAKPALAALLILVATMGHLQLRRRRPDG